VLVLSEWLRLGDEFGPEKVVLIEEPSVSLRAMVVVDNTAAGRAIGGVRMAPDLTVKEIARLARAMTLKNVAAGLPHGGAKSGIIADPGMASDEKEVLIRAFAKAIETMVDYIPGPDMGLDESSMAYIADEIGRAVGLPSVMGGLPLDTLGATGFGVAVAAEECEPYCGVALQGARVVVQGFGAVGTHTARFLAERGAVMVGVSDSRGGTANPDGLDIEKLLEWKTSGNPVGEFAGGSAIGHAELIGLECDVWIPAARPDVLTEANAHEVKAKVIVCGANIPATAGAERILAERGIVLVPDFIANAGGVICAAVDLAGGTAAQAFATIEDRVRTNTRAVLERSRRAQMLPRAAAEELAISRLREAMSYGRRYCRSTAGVLRP
jgi:glutamate dehydrogenase (NAD(P)+)